MGTSIVTAISKYTVDVEMRHKQFGRRVLPRFSAALSFQGRCTCGVGIDQKFTGRLWSIQKNSQTNPSLLQYDVGWLNADKRGSMNKKNHPDLSPRQIVPRLADHDEYLASKSTFCRALREQENEDDR
jgi:hypothetical protein